jgi:hypothetical protein
MDLLLIGDNHTQGILVRGLSPLVVTPFLCAIWSRGQGGGERVEQGQHILVSALPSGMAGSTGFPGSRTASDVDLNGSSECRGSPSAVGNTPLVHAEPSRLATQALIVNRLGVAQEDDLSLFDKLKRKHDLAKAIKSDNAKVPIYLWDAAVCWGEPSNDQKKALSTLRSFFLRIYHQQLWVKTWSLMQSWFGKDWYLAPGHGDRRADVEVKAIREILWQTSKNDWFEYSIGSRLLYFWFSERYQCQALAGVMVYYTRPGPTSMKQ